MPDIDKNQLIELTNNLYKLTALFPKKEPLRYKIREVGSDILASFVSSRSALVSESLGVLQGFLEIAINQNWVSPSQVLNIQAEYSKLGGGEEEISAAQSVSQDGRQGRIIQFLKEKGKAQVWQLKQVFPEVSKRTLRRDFENLLKQGLVDRIGERNDTYYQVKTA